MKLICSITAYLKLQPDDSRSLALIWRKKSELTAELDANTKTEKGCSLTGAPH